MQYSTALTISLFATSVIASPLAGKRQMDPSLSDGSGVPGSGVGADGSGGDMASSADAAAPTTTWVDAVATTSWIPTSTWSASASQWQDSSVPSAAAAMYTTDSLGNVLNVVTSSLASVSLLPTASSVAPVASGSIAWTSSVAPIWNASLSMSSIAPNATMRPFAFANSTNSSNTNYTLFQPNVTSRASRDAGIGNGYITSITSAILLLTSMALL